MRKENEKVRRIIAAAVALVTMVTACGSPTPKTIATEKEKIGNLTIEAPTGWDKDVSDEGSYTSYLYSKSTGDDTDAVLTIYYDKEPSDSISISDFDWTFEEFHQGLNVVYTDIDDNFLGDKPIRIGHGTWSYDDGDKAYNLTTVAMYDADYKRIEVNYVYLDSLANEGYASYADTLVDTMELIYDYS